MPVYEYRCLDCHEIFEKTEPMSDHAAARPACPRCKGTSVEQVFSQFFAKTDRKS